MSRRRKATKPAERRPEIDPETGLPPVRKHRPPSREEMLRRARAKHEAKDRRPR